MPINEKKIKGVAELVGEILKIVESLPEGASLWYRGQTKQSYSLLPGLMRQGKEAQEVFEREKRLITRFRQRSLPYWPEGYPQNDWEHMFAMQHYGIPTRLLDFSENVFIALHFALTPGTEEPPCLWCVDPVAWNRATPVLSEFGDDIHVLTTIDDDSEPYRPDANRKRNKSPVAMFGTHNSNRIVAQRGTFFVWGEDINPLENFAKDSAADTWKFLFEESHSSLLSQLNGLGFYESMVFPELTALSAEISRVEGWR